MTKIGIVTAFADCDNLPYHNSVKISDYHFSCINSPHFIQGHAAASEQAAELPAAVHGVRLQLHVALPPRPAHVLGGPHPVPGVPAHLPHQGLAKKGEGLLSQLNYDLITYTKWICVVTLVKLVLRWLKLHQSKVVRGKQVDVYIQIMPKQNQYCAFGCS